MADNATKKPPTLPQTCAVCGETSNQVAIHYARLLCNGCRAFFKRTVQGKMKVADCKLRGECKVNPASRKDCKPCRYQACLRAGVDINKVQPARESSSDSACRERKTEEDDESISRKSKSRLEAAPSMVPEQFQYPNHHYPVNPHQHLAFPHLFSMTTTVSPALPAILPPTNPKLFPAPFLSPFNPPYHHLHQSPYMSATATPNSDNGISTLIRPTPINNTANFGFNTFNIHHYNNNTTSSSSSSSNNGNHSNLYQHLHPNHHPSLSAMASSHDIPFIGATQGQGQNIPEHLVNLQPSHGNIQNPVSVHNQTHDVNHQQHQHPLVPEKLQSHSVFDIQQHNKAEQTFPGYDLTRRSLINVHDSNSQSTSSLLFPKVETAYLPVSNENFANSAAYLKGMTELTKWNNLLTSSSKADQKNNSQKSSTFMIDTLLEQHDNMDSSTTISKSTNDIVKTTHQEVTTSSHKKHTVKTTATTYKQESNDERDNVDVVTTTEDSESSSSEIHSTTSHSQKCGEKLRNMSSDILVVDYDQEANCAETIDISRILPPTFNHDNADNNDDEIFTYPDAQHQSMIRYHSNASHKRSEIFSTARERLTSTPNQKKHPSCDSPEVELNVVDITNTPSPIDTNGENSSDSESNSEENNEEFRSIQQKSDGYDVPHSSLNSPVQIDLKMSPEDETNSEGSSSGKNANSLYDDVKNATYLVTVGDKSESKSVTFQNGFSRDESDDSGVASRSHSYNNSSLTASSSTTSISKNNSTSFDSKTKESTSFEEIISPDQIQKTPKVVISQINDNYKSESDSFNINHNSYNTGNDKSDSTSSLDNESNNSYSSGLESRGSYSDFPSLKRSTPRKWKRFSSNENLKLVNPINSPKRVKCVSPVLKSPSKGDGSDATACQSIEKDCKDEELRASRERLGEIKNFENCTNETNNKHSHIPLDSDSKVSEPSNNDSLLPKLLENSNNDHDKGKNSVKGHNCVNSDSSQAKTSSVPLETASISSFLDSIIQRIRNADSDIEVSKAKQELENFYSTSDYK